MSLVLYNHPRSLVYGVKFCSVQWTVPERTDHVPHMAAWSSVGLLLTTWTSRTSSCAWEFWRYTWVQRICQVGTTWNERHELVMGIYWSTIATWLNPYYKWWFIMIHHWVGYLQHIRSKRGWLKIIKWPRFLVQVATEQLSCSVCCDVKLVFSRAYPQTYLGRASLMLLLYLTRILSLGFSNDGHAVCRRHIVDEDQLFRESSFPIPPKKLVRLAKMFLATEAIGNNGPAEWGRNSFARKIAREKERW